MDWKQLIADLRANGLTQTQIADQAKVAQSFVSELSTGTKKEPGYSIGQRLVAMHKQVTRLAPKRKKTAPQE